MNEKTKLYCILNPLSSDGKALRKWIDIEKVLGELDIDYELVRSGEDICETTLSLLKSGVDENDCLAGLGGDGTQHAVINGIMRYREEYPEARLPYFSVIPLGTGNNIAKSFNMSPRQNLLFSELRRCLAGAVRGAEFRVDLGRIDGVYFLDAFTVGIDAHILAGRNRDRQTISRSRFMLRMLKGYPLYLFNTLKSMGTSKSVSAELRVDGKSFYSGKICNIVINNTRIYAGEFDLTDNACANDGLLDVLVFKGPRDYLRRYLLGHRYLPRKMRMLADSARHSLEHAKGRSFEIRLGEKLPAQVDGEELDARLEFRVDAVPRAVKLRIPVEPA